MRGGVIIDPDCHALLHAEGVTDCAKRGSSRNVLAATCHNALVTTAGIAAPGLLEIVVAVRAVLAPDVEEQRSTVQDARPQRVVILEGFTSAEAALEAAHAIADCCSRWGHARGLQSRPVAVPSDKVDEQASTDEMHIKSPCADEERRRISISCASVGSAKDCPSHPSEELRPNHLSLPTQLSMETMSTTATEGAPWGGSSSATSAEETASSTLGAAYVSTSGGAWSHEGHRILLHRDSMDLSSTTVTQKRPKSASSRTSSKVSSSKLWSFIGRSGDDRNEKSDASEEEIDLSRWSALSEARETALLNKEPKSLGRRRRLSLSSITRGEGIKFFPKNIANLGNSQSRSQTPPRNRNGDAADGLVPGQLDGASCDKGSLLGTSLQRLSPRSAPAANYGSGKLALLEILDTASNCRCDDHSM